MEIRLFVHKIHQLEPDTGKNTQDRCGAAAAKTGQEKVGALPQHKTGQERVGALPQQTTGLEKMRRCRNKKRIRRESGRCRNRKLGTRK